MKKRAPGRPALGKAARSKVVALRLTEAEYRAAMRAAGDLSLGDYIRQLLTAA